MKHGIARHRINQCGAETGSSPAPVRGAAAADIDRMFLSGASMTAMSSEDDSSDKPKQRPWEARTEDNSYWGRPNLLSRFSSMGLRGRLAWIGGVALAANGVALIFGFFWPRMLIAGIAVLLVALLLPASADD